MRFCTFSGVNSGFDPAFKHEAQLFAREVAARGDEIVYGGGGVGMMGAVADACLEAGGTVTGIIPEFLIKQEIAHTGLTRMITTTTMDERKKLMMDMADCIVMLPGGFGSLEEFFVAITASQLGLQKKPVVVLNVNGFYDPLIALYDRVIEGGFAPANDRSYILVCKTAAEVFEKLPTFHYVRSKKFLG